MTRVTCAFCGLPFRVRAPREGVSYYCCSGCALASRIPVNEGQLPVSRELVIALAFGFGLFNQVLFAVLGAAVTGEGHTSVGAQLMLVSMAIGALVHAAGVAFVGLSRRFAWSDALSGLVGYGVAAWAARSVWTGAVPSAQWLLAAANLWLGAWLSRGWLRRAFVRRTASAQSGSVT